MIKHIPFLVLLLSLSACNITVNEIEHSLKYPIIPTPQSAIYEKEELTFNTVQLNSVDFTDEAQQLISFFESKNIQNTTKGIVINLLNEKVTDNEEGYSLTINTEISIKATSKKGIFYGIQTLKQLLRKHKKAYLLPKVKIIDWPAFKIRGFMHDTGRNYQSVALLKEQIDVLANYKYNVFHWHLTDNPGWRLESKLYPELTADKALFRKKGKFYTQEDFKEILAYCKERHITLIPEFDIPGHTKAFRTAFDLESMRDPKVPTILFNLIDELCSLASPEDMPYIHLGTDEVRNKEEYVSKDFILSMLQKVQENKREVIVWKEGIHIKQDTTSINQLWASNEARKGHRFIDSRSNYINHLDPLAGMARLFFQQPCRQAKGDSLALGGILCAWPDNNIDNERDILKQNPIYPSIVFYADAIWKGRKKDYPAYWAKLPTLTDPNYTRFKYFEQKVLQHKQLFFQNKEFPYVAQSDINWKVIGPFDHKNEVTTQFPIEKEIKKSYTINNNTFTWKDAIVGGTVHLRHFFGFESLTTKKEGTFYAYTNIYSPTERIQDFWIGFHGWSRSGGRRGGPTPPQGQWYTSQPKVWVNQHEIAPPIWKQPNLPSNSAEIPFIDEDYFYRKPTKISLQRGWNTVLLKIPSTKQTFKWMYTFVPVNKKGMHYNLASDIIFDPKFPNK